MTDKLKELALAANVLDHNESSEWYDEEGLLESRVRYLKNARYIAAASPDAILALIKRAENAESINEAGPWMLQREYEALQAKVERLKAQEPVAWCDDNCANGSIGNVCSDAAKRYWEKNGWADKLLADKHTIPLFAQPTTSAQPLTCTWTQEDDFDMPGVYETSCGEMWSFTEGGLKENNANFCPHCGGTITASPEKAAISATKDTAGEKV